MTSGVLGTHDFAVDTGDHGHDAHWSWVDSPPTDNPSVTSVSYFVHSTGHGGSAMTAAQQADMIVAAEVWNTAGANVELNQVFNDAAADVHVHMDTTSGCGGGIGCAEFSYFTAHSGDYGPASGHPEGPGATHPQHQLARNTVAPLIQELTMLDDSTFGGSWYSGPAGGIGGSNYDFLTVAIQEFGHHLGLEHNDLAHGHGDFASSPMNGVLPNGVTRRVLQTADDAAIIHLYGASLTEVPEPSTLVLTLLGFAGLASYSRRGRVAR